MVYSYLPGSKTEISHEDIGQGERRNMYIEGMHIHTYVVEESRYREDFWEQTWIMEINYNLILHITYSLNTKKMMFFSKIKKKT